MPTDIGEGSAGVNLQRMLFEEADAKVEVGADASKRIRLKGKYDECVLTPQGEVVIVHHDGDRDELDTRNKTVYARSTSKASHLVIRLRLLQAVEQGLQRAEVLGSPDQPATFEQWKQHHREEAATLQQQVDVMCLAAEKTHQFSAQVFEPSLLAAFDERTDSFRLAVAHFYRADALRRHILAETGRRVSLKSTSDPEKRKQYVARKRSLYERTAGLYSKACDLYQLAQAGLMAKRSQELADRCVEAMASNGSTPSSNQDTAAPLLRNATVSSVYEDARKLIDPADKTLQNTVRTINGLGDPATRGTLERGFAGHLVRVAKTLRTAPEVIALFGRVRELREAVAADAFINRERIDQYLALIAREHPNLFRRSSSNGGTT